MASTKKKRIAIIGATVVGTLAIAATGVAVANATGNHGGSGPHSAIGKLGDAVRDMGRPAEEPLTGDDATKVEAAVTAAYPDATIDRMEKDADGGAVFEAHITKADGSHATVQLDATYTITGETAGGPDGHGPDGHGPGGRGPGHHGHDGDGPMGSDSASDTDAAGATA